MKSMILSAFVTLTATTAMAAIGDMVTRQTSIPTVVSCEQTDGDQWLRIGIAKSSNGYTAYLVMNDDDDNSKTLLEEVAVTPVKTTENRVSFVNKELNFKLEVKKVKGGREGAFTFVKPGPPDDDRMDCFLNDQIVYDYTVVLEPRMSVGN